MCTGLLALLPLGHREAAETIGVGARPGGGLLGRAGVIELGLRGTLRGLLLGLGGGGDARLGLYDGGGAPGRPLVGGRLLRRGRLGGLVPGLRRAARLGGVCLLQAGDNSLLGGVALLSGPSSTGGSSLARLLSSCGGLLLELGGQLELGGALDAVSTALGDLAVAQHGPGELVGHANHSVQGYSGHGGLR